MQPLRRCLYILPGLWRLALPLLILAACLPLSAIAIPLIERKLIDNVMQGHQLRLLAPILVTYAIVWVLSTLTLVAGSLMRTYMDERVTMRLRQALLIRCQTLSIAFSDREHSGRTLALFGNDVPIVAGLFSGTLSTIVGCLIAAGGGAVVMWNLSWQLAIVGGIIPPVVAALAWLTTRPLRPAARKAQDKAAELTKHITENLAGMREIVAFTREHSQNVNFIATLADLLRLRMRVALFQSALSSGQLVFSLAVTLVILGYGSVLIVHGETTLGTVIAMRSLFSLVFQPVAQLAGMVGTIQQGLASADRVALLLDEQPDVVEMPHALSLDHVDGHVVFDNVSFGYDALRPVLRSISFEVRPGEVVALVGQSGAGKSTLASLVARFYDPQAGCIRVDGIDLRDVTLSSLRSQIAMVFQDTYLFAGSIRENIAFGRDGASDAAIRAAAEAAHATEFIEHLPLGFDTLVGERGVQLSEGQRQRIAIARALLRDPRLLILDEPTSALDARTEYEVQAALEQLMQGRTTLVIAHRLATVRSANRILVLDGGEIAEEGTHAELLAQHGLYRHLYDLQFAPEQHVQELVVAPA